MLGRVREVPHGDLDLRVDEAVALHVGEDVLHGPDRVRRRLLYGRRERSVAAEGAGMKKKEAQGLREEKKKN